MEAEELVADVRAPVELLRGKRLARDEEELADGPHERVLPCDRLADAHQAREERVARVFVGWCRLRGLGGKRGERGAILRKRSLRIRIGLQVVRERLRAAEQDVERVAVFGPDERLAVQHLALGRLEVGYSLGAARARLVPHGDVARKQAPRLRRLLAGDRRRGKHTGDAQDGQYR